MVDILSRLWTEIGISGPKNSSHPESATMNTSAKKPISGHSPDSSSYRPAGERFVDVHVAHGLDQMRDGIIAVLALVAIHVGLEVQLQEFS